MFEVPLLLVLIILVALAFDFTNGAHDCANAIATVVSTKALSPRAAVVMAAVLNLGGALLGTEVARTLGAGIVHPDVVAGSHLLVLAALCGAIVWNVITWYFGIPSSSSHALIGGLVGAAVACTGFGALHVMSIVNKVLVPLVVSPLAGFSVAFLFMWAIYWVCHRMSRSAVNKYFHRMQILSAGCIATSHGLNDAQKTMGVITLALVVFGQLDAVEVPFWVKCLCAFAMAGGRPLAAGRSSRPWGTKSSNWSRYTALLPTRLHPPSSLAHRCLARPSAPRTPSPPASVVWEPPSASRQCAGAWRGIWWWPGC